MQPSADGIDADQLAESFFERLRRWLGSGFLHFLLESGQWLAQVDWFRRATGRGAVQDLVESLVEVQDAAIGGQVEAAVEHALERFPPGKVRDDPCGGQTD